jgi:diacylglycerol O-acyltransferase-1
VFFFSAAQHEIIIAVPFRHVTLHAFFGMLLQAPLVYLTKHFDKTFDIPFVGNAFFWIVFCIIGQPMGVIIYFYDMWKLSNPSTAI